jgi:hypothetical protein
LPQVAAAETIGGGRDLQATAAATTDAGEGLERERGVSEGVDCVGLTDPRPHCYTSRNTSSYRMSILESVSDPTRSSRPGHLYIGAWRGRCRLD